MIRYAVIDTNVLVSAMLKENSVPRKVINAVFEGKIIPLFDDEILREYEEVVSRPKFKNTPQSIDFFMNGMRDHGKYIEAVDFNEILPDPKDAIFLSFADDGAGRGRHLPCYGEFKTFPDKAVYRDAA